MRFPTARAPLSAMPALACLLLAGCQTLHQVFGFNPAYPSPSRTGAFDGSYFGRARPVRADPGAGCPVGRTGVVEVGDKRMSFAYLPEIVFNPPIGPDGRFTDKAGHATLEGRIEGDELTMRVVTPGCETRYELSAIGNRS